MDRELLVRHGHSIEAFWRKFRAWMWPMSVTAAFCLVYQYGFGVTPTTAPIIFGLEMAVVFFFAAETILQIVFGPHRKVYLRRHWIEVLLVGLFLVHAVFLRRITDSLGFSLENIGLDQRGYMTLIQLYLVGVLVVRILRYLQKLAFLRLPPVLLVVFTFAFLCIAGSLVLELPLFAAGGKKIPYIDTLFTATSAVCVTGLAVRDIGTDFAMRGQIAVLTLIQVGGLGIMTIAAISAVLLGRGLGVRERAVLRDVLNMDALSSIMRILAGILLVTVSTELIGAGLLYVFWDQPGTFGNRVYLAIFHSISAFCNAGFSPLSDNLMGQRGNAPVILTIAGLITVGGLGFAVAADIMHPKYPNRRGFWSRLSLHSRLVLTTSLCLTFGGMLLIGLLDWRRGFIDVSAFQGWLDAFFQSVTARTAGFNSIPTERLATPAVLVVCYLMFVGASPGSTGGGIKTTTFVVLLAFLRSLVQNKNDVEIGHRRISSFHVRAALAVFLLSILWVAVSTGVLCASERLHLADGSYPTLETPTFTAVDYLFEEVSAFGTVGLSRGVTPHLSTHGKLMIILSMFLGRVGPLTLLLTLAQRGRRPSYTYPEESVMIG